MIASDKGVANPVEVAARATQKLISIHPFSDANGRTGQFVMNFILQRAGLPPATLSNPNFAVFGGIPEDNDPNVLIDAAVEKVKDGINRTCGFVNIESPFMNEE